MKKNAPLDDSSPDRWKEKLQEALKQERPSPRRWGLWLSVALLGLLALVTWWLSPRPTPPLPPLVAFDVLIAAGQEAPVRAVFEMPEEGQPRPRLTGRRFHFQESRLPLPGEELSGARLTLENDRAAAATLKAPAPRAGLAAALRQTAYEAHLPGEDRQLGVKDQAHIFTFQADANLLLVTVEATLARATLGEWDQANPREVPVRAEAPPILHAARKRGYEVAYLALESDRPTTYQTMRVWARFRFGNQPAFLPDGPVLGRPDYPGDADTAYSRVLADLKDRFPGAHAAVTSSPTAARRFQAAGLRAILVGDADPIPNVERAAGWDSLMRVLEK